MALIMLILGMVLGGLAVVINDRIVEERTERLRRENRKLMEKIHEDRVEYESAAAYRRGFRNGLNREKAKKTSHHNAGGEVNA